MFGVLNHMFNEFSDTHSFFHFGCPFEEQTFPVVVDSGATASVSYCKEDFITPLSPSPFRQMKGLAETLDVEGRGILWWIVNDDSGHELTIETEAYYVPAMSMRLLSPQAYFRGIRQGHAIVRPDHIQLCWDKENQVLTIPCDPINNLPIVQAGRKEEKKKMLRALANWVYEETNQNLTPAQKELLKWHFRLGHISFGWLQQLAHKPSLGLPTKIGRLARPLCAACQFGKAKRQAVP